MSLTDFLFQGSPPPSVTTYSSTSSQLPPWFEGYQQGLLGRANVVAGEPWQQYQLPPQASFDAVANARIAPFTEDTKTGWNLGREAATSYDPTLRAGIDATTGALAAPGAGATANPFIQRGALSWPSQAGAYMNPFTEHVASRLVDLSNRNLFENVLPNVNDNFVKSGMFGSSRHGDFTNRAVRDQGESLLGALSNAYSSAYNQGASQFSADASRQLEAGNLAGTFANTDRSMAGALGTNLSNLAAQQQRLGLTGAAIHQGIGSEQQAQQQRALDTNYQNFVEQREYPREQARFMNEIIRGLQAPQSTTTTTTAPSSNYNAPPFAQLLGAATGLAGLFGKARGGRVHARRKRIRGYL